MPLSRRSFLLFVCLAAAYFTAADAQDTDPKREMYRIQAGHPDKDGWYQAESTLRHFKVRLPGPFNDFRVSGGASDAVKDSSILGMVTKDGSKWVATLASYENAVAAKSYFDNFEKAMGRGKGLTARTFQYRDRPAKEIWINSGARSAAMREVLVGHDAYLLIVEYDTLKAKDLTSGIHLFLDSLEFSPSSD